MDVIKPRVIFSLPIILVGLFFINTHHSHGSVYSDAPNSEEDVGGLGGIRPPNPPHLVLPQIATFTISQPLTRTQQILFAPLLIKQPTTNSVTSTTLHCATQALDIPDNDPRGVSSTIYIEEPRNIVDLDVSLNVIHTWVGDLVVKLNHQESGKTVTLIDRPGVPADDSGCGEDNIAVILDDDLSSQIENKCANISPAISGIYIPNESLSVFNSEILSGSWTITIIDSNISDSGRLNQWCLEAEVNEFPITPTPTPTVDPLPPRVNIPGVYGRPQSLPLDCESRSAVDWATYFGVQINELTFFNNLPRSDNPDVGFVGDVNGRWGQIPPAPYGVHAEPVAKLLQNYGLSAYAKRPLNWDSLRAEIADRRPVIVWIVGSVINGIPTYYTALDGHITVVARHEHTVIVTGYTETSVSFLNGDTIYSRSLDQFLDSWSVMRNMAITSRP